jgi:uncharacterized protein YeeX (DUF496 family)
MPGPAYKEVKEFVSQQLKDSVFEQYIGNITKLVGDRKKAVVLVENVMKLNTEYTSGKIDKERLASKFEKLVDDAVPKDSFGKKFLWNAVFWLTPSFGGGSQVTADKIAGREENAKENILRGELGRVLLPNELTIGPISQIKPKKTEDG